MSKLKWDTIVTIIERYLATNSISEEDYYIIRKYVRYFLTKKQFHTKYDDIDDFVTEIVWHFITLVKTKNHFKSSYTSYQKHKYLNLLIWTAIYEITVNKDFMVDIPPYLLRPKTAVRYRPNYDEPILQKYHTVRTYGFVDDVLDDPMLSIKDDYDMMDEVDNKMKLEFFLKEGKWLLTEEERNLIHEHFIEWRTYVDIWKEFEICGEYVRQKVDKWIHKFKKYLDSRGGITI